MPEESLKDKTVKGVAWSGVEQVAQYSITFVVSVILARLLSPDDYGLIGLTGVFTAVCQSIIGGGMGTALIRKKDATEDDYNTAFVLNLGMSLLLYVVIFLFAPLIADFFGRQELISLTRVSSLSLIIGALALVQTTRLTKRIDFKTQTQITLKASIASGVVGIILAIGGLGVWALVAQAILNQIVRTISLWIANHWTPELRFSMKSFRELFGFGWKLVVSSLLDSIWGELHQVVVGKFYSSASLGQYTRAQGFAQLFSVNLTGVVRRVSFPVLSNIQDNPENMVAVYRRIIKMTMFLSATCMFFLGAISEPLLHCLIGAKWHMAAIFLPFICISGSMYPLHALNLNMLQVLGRSDLFLGLEIIKKIIAIVPLIVGATVGIIPMLLVNIVTGVISFFLNSYYSGKLLNYSSWMQIRDVAHSYCFATILAACVFFLKFLPFSYWLILPAQFLLGASIFFFFCNKTKIEEYDELKGIIRPYICKFIKR